MLNDLSLNLVCLCLCVGGCVCVWGGGGLSFSKRRSMKRVAVSEYTVKCGSPNIHSHSHTLSQIERVFALGTFLCPESHTRMFTQLPPSLHTHNMVRTGAFPQRRHFTVNKHISLHTLHFTSLPIPTLRQNTLSFHCD